MEETVIMKTKAVRLYGQSDLRLEEFELPEIKDNEILARVVSDSICMSSYKAAIQGANHKRVPNDIDTNPIIIGHEFCGDIVKVGAKWQHKFKEGSKFGIQPAMNLKENPYIAPGYSYQFIGGDATYIIIPNEVMESDCLMTYEGDSSRHLWQNQCLVSLLVITKTITACTKHTATIWVLKKVVQLQF